ncbi:MAG: hypothetical protein EAZ15_06125 [Sphingobacteriales bacterium]|nr:MAG: hypothetical protein EAZ15_06125 [Sphingobacteriales bacterium]
MLSIMKKLCLFIVSTAFSLNSFAQLEKNTWMLGGTANLSAYKQTFTINNYYKGVSNKLNFKIAPNVGYFIADKLNLGLRTSYESLQEYFVENSPSRLHNLTLGPFARYYVLNSEKVFNILVDVSYQLGYNWWVQKPIDNTGKLNPKNTNNFTISAGPVVFLTENVAIELTLGYTYQNAITKDFSKSICKSFNTGIGFQYHF